MKSLSSRRRFLGASASSAAAALVTTQTKGQEVKPAIPTIVRTHDLMAREADKHLWTLHQSTTSRTNLVLMTGEGTRHLHPDAEHSLYVISGEVKATVGDQELMLGPGDYISIPAGVPHSYLASREKPALLISMDAPAYDPAKTIRLKAETK